jgi:hypothetical protein
VQADQRIELLEVLVMTIDTSMVLPRGVVPSATVLLVGTMTTVPALFGAAEQAAMASMYTSTQFVRSSATGNFMCGR